MSDYTESPLGRVVEVAWPAAGDELVAVLTTLNTLWIFEADGLQSIMGPLDITLAGTLAPVSIAIDDSASRIFAAGPDAIGGYDMEGSEIWSESIDATYGLGFAGGYLFNASRTSVTETDDTLHLQARNPSTGDVAASALVAQNTIAPYTCGAAGMAIRKNASGVEQLFLLHGIQTGSTEDIILSRWTLGFDGGVSISKSGSRTIHDDRSTGFPAGDSSFGVGAGPENVYCLHFLSGSTPNRYDAYDPASLSDDDTEDFGYPVAGVNAFDPPEVSGAPATFIDGTNAGLKKYDLSGALVATSDATESPARLKHLISVSRDTTVALDEIPSATIDTSPYSVQAAAPGATFWDLQAAPSGATVNASGLVSWPSPVSAGSPHAFRLYASNGSSWSVAEWAVTVT